MMQQIIKSSDNLNDLRNYIIPRNVAFSENHGDCLKINRNYKCVGNSELPSSGNMQYVIFFQHLYSTLKKTHGLT